MMFHVRPIDNLNLTSLIDLFPPILKILFPLS